MRRRETDFALLVIRIIVAIVFFAHGTQKVFGWFGGPGLSGWVRSMTSHGMPAVVPYLVAFGELLGAIALLFGFLTRLAAAGLLIEMLGAIFLVHRKMGFFMNWTGKLKGEGFEYSLTLAVVLLSLLIAGAGDYSLDASVFRSRWRRR
jgi:putative oxidoreductase